MPTSLADGKTKLAILATKPADPKAPTITELEAGIEASCRILSNDYNVGPTSSETIDEKPLCVEGNVQVPGPSNYTAEFSAFRYFDELTGKAEEGGAGTGDEAEIGDAVFQAVKQKGTRLWLVERETSLESTKPWTEGDEVSVYEVLTDNPQKPGDSGGYIKRRIVTLVQDAWLNGEVAGSGGSGEG